MTAEKLHDAIGLLPADLVTEADRQRGGKPKIIPWKRYAALAACFVLVLFAGRFVLLLTAPKGAGAAKTEAAMDMPAAAAPMEAAPMEPAAAEEWASDAENGEGCVLAEPPALQVSSGEASIMVGCLWLTWELRQEDGTSQSMIVDAALPEDTFDTCERLETKEPQLQLRWETLPDSVTFRSWHRDGETVIPDVFEGGNGVFLNGEGVYALSAAHGTHLYEITAHWPQGWATYTFRVTAD